MLGKVYTEPWVDPLGWDDFLWLQLLCQLSSVKTLFVANDSTNLISHTLVYLNREMIAKVLPALKLLCLEDQPKPSLDRFLAACMESGNRVTFVQTKEEFDEKCKFYP